MYDSEMKRKLTLDYLRQEKQFEELSHMKMSPTISPQSVLILEKKTVKLNFYET